MNYQPPVQFLLHRWLFVTRWLGGNTSYAVNLHLSHWFPWFFFHLWCGYKQDKMGMQKGRGESEDILKMVYFTCPFFHWSWTLWGSNDNLLDQFCECLPSATIHHYQWLLMSSLCCWCSHKHIAAFDADLHQAWKTEEWWMARLQFATYVCTSCM